MSTSTEKRKQGTTLPRAIFKINPVAVGCAVLMLASGAYAQNTLDTVTVTGIRKGIEDAISVKKNSDSIVEAISAEDIGKLPDVSIAESIARLPGLTAQRTNGRATAISVRGFSPDFSTALLNGREQVSTGDSRYVEFDQYPSELMSGVTVYKTPDGALIGQGLSATINMQSIRPLDVGKRTVSVNYRKQQLGKGLTTESGDGSRFNIAYIDQFADRTIGVAIGYARLTETSGTTQNYGSWGTGTATVDGATVKVPGGFNDLVDKTKNQRDAVMATLQYKPNKAFSSTLDVFYTKFDINQLEQGVQVPLSFTQSYENAALTGTTIGGGVATAGTYTGFKGVSRNDSTATHDKVSSIGWNNKLDMGVWTGMLDLATSEAKRKSAQLQTTAGLAGNCNVTASGCGSVSWTGFDGNNVSSAKYTVTPGLSDATRIKLTDVEGWGGNIANGASTTPQAGYSNQPLTDDKLNAVRISAKRDLPEGGFFSNVDVGINFSDRSKTRTYIEGRLRVGTETQPFAAVDVPGGAVATAPQTGLQYLAWNPDGSIGSVYNVASKLVGDIANKNWSVKEKVTTAYTKLDIDSTLAGMPLRGNAGVQLIRTQQSSTAFGVDGANCPADVCSLTNSTGGTSYYDFLPSVNLGLDIGNGQNLRLGLGRQMARPTLNDMRASMNFGYDNTKADFGGSAGNPALKPFRANALDLSYEKYFGTKAYFSAAVFAKQLSSYIVKTDVPFDYSNYVSATTPKPTGATNVGRLTIPLNGTGGNIQGIELAGSFPLGIVTSWLDGFGVQANMSYTKSSVNLPTSGLQVQNISTPTIPLPGLSKQVASLTLYYEKHGFGFRVAERYRSDFVGSITSQVGDNQLVYIKSEKITDAQISYEFDSGVLKGLSLLLQANNLTNTPYIEYQDTPSNIKTNVKYGKNYLFGLSYKL